MTKAGEKLIAAAQEALSSARCRHKWKRVSTRVEGGMVTGTIDHCDKCGTRRTILPSPPRGAEGGE